MFNELYSEPNEQMLCLLFYSIPIYRARGASLLSVPFKVTNSEELLGGGGGPVLVMCELTWISMTTVR